MIPAEALHVVCPINPTARPTARLMELARCYSWPEGALISIATPGDVISHGHAMSMMSRKGRDPKTCQFGCVKRWRAAKPLELTTQLRSIKSQLAS